LAESNDTRRFVSGRAVILGEFCFDNDFWIKFVGNDEVGSLIKLRNALGTLSFSIGNACGCENVFDG